MCYLIDGYNSLYYLIPESVKRFGLEQARNEFIKMVLPVSRKMRPKKLLVVFDSDSTGNSKEYSPFFKVLFAPHQTADDWIGKTVRTSTKFIVISDDTEVQQHARTAGVPFRTNHDFFTAIGVIRPANSSRKTSSREKTRKDPPPKLPLNKEAEMFGFDLDDSFEIDL